jgi:branched-chain amino acid transport system substrate-binding protein
VGPSSTIAEKYKVPMIESAGNAASLFGRGLKYLFCTLPLADEQPKVFMRLLDKQSPKPKTVAIIAPKTPFYLSSANGFKKYAEKSGFEVAHFETYPPEMEDLTPILQKVKAKNPDVLCVGSHTIVAMMVMKQSKQIDFNPKAYCFSYGLSVPEFVQELGKDAEYAMELTYMSLKAPYSDSLFGTTRQFFEIFYKKHGFYPDGTHQGAVAAGMAFLKAIQRAEVTPPLGEAERIKVREELAKLDIVTSAGPVKFDSTGINVANPLGVKQIQKGKMVVVEPKDWAEAEFIYPCPKWKDR